MVAVICDSCKKEISDARRGENYVSMMDKTLCFNCNDKLNEMSKESMKNQSVYTIKKYTDSKIKILSKICK